MVPLNPLSALVPFAEWGGPVVPGVRGAQGELVVPGEQGEQGELVVPGVQGEQEELVVPGVQGEQEELVVPGVQGPLVERREPAGLGEPQVPGAIRSLFPSAEPALQSLPGVPVEPGELERAESAGRGLEPGGPGEREPGDQMNPVPLPGIRNL